MYELALSLICVSLGCVIGFLINRGNLRLERERLKNALEAHASAERYSASLKEQSDDFEEKWMQQLDHNKELIRQKSSQATKSGNYIETLSPLLEKFPVNIFDSNTSTKWLGDPIDFIAFNFELPEIIFIEIKSGDANLSQRQKLIKKAIKEGMVRFVEVRMNSDGTTESSE